MGSASGPSSSMAAVTSSTARANAPVRLAASAARRRTSRRRGRSAPPSSRSWSAWPSAVAAGALVVRLPQLERQLVVVVGLRRGVSGLGRARRGEGGGQGLVAAVGTPPVVGQLGQVLDAGRTPAALPLRGHLLGVARVVPASLAGQDVAVDRLVEQRVAELVAPPLGLHRDEVGRLRLPQRLRQVRLVQGDHRGEPVVRDPPAADRRGPQHLLRVRREPAPRGRSSPRSRSKGPRQAHPRPPGPAPPGRTGSPPPAGRWPRPSPDRPARRARRPAARMRPPGRAARGRGARRGAGGPARPAAVAAGGHGAGRRAGR